MFLRHRLALVVFYVVVVAFILMQSKLFSLPLSLKKTFIFYWIIFTFLFIFGFSFSRREKWSVIVLNTALRCIYDTIRYVTFCISEFECLCASTTMTTYSFLPLTPVEFFCSLTFFFLLAVVVVWIFMHFSCNCSCCRRYCCCI